MRVGWLCRGSDRACEKSRKCGPPGLKGIGPTRSIIFATRNQSPQGAHHHTTMPKGKTRCPQCDGTGVWEYYYDEPEECPLCDGAGIVSNMKAKKFRREEAECSSK